MPCRKLCNGTFQKSYEARSGLDLASSHGTSVRNKRYGVGSCFLDMSGGVWQSGLDTAAGGNVDFQVWHYDDWGNYHRIY